MIKIASALSLAVLLTGCEFGDFGNSDRFQSDFHYSYDIAPDGRIDVEGQNGSIEITGWDENKVDISGTKYGATEQLRDSIRVDIHNTPTSVDVRTMRPTSNFGNAGVRYTIRVPRKAHLDRILTSNSSIQVSDVAAASHLKSSNGHIRVRNVNSDVDARTSNSSIDLDGVRGNATLRSSNGRITAEGVMGECDAETTNSSIKVRMESAPAAPIRLVTSNGAIDLTMDHAPKNDVRAQTRNSSITVRLPANSSARVSADTTNSSISSDFDLRSESGENHRKNHMEGMLGGGGPRVDLVSTNGHIRIVKGSGE